MRPLQRPRPSPPADAGIQLPCSGPCERQDVRALELAANLKVLKSVIFLKTIITYISHTLCSYCFVLCPACILTVLSAWKLASKKRPFRSKSVFRPAREQR
ncbi:unnamed protein product [Staurois parvus]|uniref:Uncharacterized protein n=1 Tax=Staurois parvus TaxID=386267 RepID=A0ABN9BC97_9NEOB|nr:unnamed protein product [Staurois parvus]